MSIWDKQEDIKETTVIKKQESLSGSRIKAVVFGLERTGIVLDDSFFIAVMWDSFDIYASYVGYYTREELGLI